jgi:hypothetical protein
VSYEDKIEAALRAANGAETPSQRDAHEREAIKAWRQIALDKGLDGVLLNRALRDASAHGAENVTRNDLDTPSLTPLSAWALFALALNDLRLGLFRTRAGESLINAAKAMAEGRGSWLVENLSRQGVDSNSEKREALYLSVVGFAAAYEANAECGQRTALAVAATEYGAIAAKIGVPLDPEALRRRVNDAGNERRKEDPLAGHYRRMLKATQNGGLEAVEETRKGIVAETATIRGKTSP